MKPVSGRIKEIPWYGWTFAVCVIIYLTYISVSFFYLPGKLKGVIETDASKIIGRKIHVGDIRFNPFILSLTVKDFAISDRPEAPLVAWNQLTVNINFWKSVFFREIAFDGIMLNSPAINIIRQKDGFNFSEIIERLSADNSNSDNKQEKSGKSGSIAIEIANTSINKGTFKYTDTSGKVTARANLDDISIMVDRLYFATGDEHLNPFSFNAVNKGGGHIQLAGNYRINPLRVEGNIRAEGIDMSAMSRFLENVVPLKLRKGILSFSTNILATNDSGFMLKTEKGDLSISSLAIDDNVPDPSLFNAGSISVKDLSFDLTGRKVMAEKVLLDKITINQWIGKNGRPRYEGLLPEKGHGDADRKPEESGEEEKTGAPWDVVVKKFSIENSTVNFKDLNEKIKREHSLSGIDLELGDVSLAPESRISIQLAAMLDEKGNINAGGYMCLSPFSMDLDYHLDKIPLNPFSDYLEAATWLSIENGSLSANGKVSMGKDKGTGINAAANLDLDDFTIKDTRSKRQIFSLNSFKVDGIKADTDKKNVTVASVNISKPDLSVSVSDKKQLNLAGVMKEKEAGQGSEPPAAKESKPSDWNFEVGKVNLSDGTVLFSDKSVKPAYKTGMYNIAFSMGHIGSEIKSTAPFSFNTKIDKYAPFSIKGRLDPFDKQPGFTLKSTLAGLEMPPLSPYSDVYIGNNLKSGKLTLNLDYSLHGGKLKGSNNINAKNLYLGEKVPGKPVINAPVGLGLALLRDISGVIDLDVGVSGNLDDPGFSVSGVIVKALVNIIVKAAASPFELLAALIPGGSNNLGDVTFDPGDSALNQEGKKSLKTLFDALNKRPQLVLNIKGNASGPEDIEALKVARLIQQVAKKRGVPLSKIEEELKAQKLWAIAENHPALEAINNEMGLTAVSVRMEKLKPAENSAKTENPKGTEAKGSGLTEQDIYKQVYDDVLAAEKVDEEDLLSLAEARALSIEQYLVEDLKLSNKRISVIKATQSDLSGRVVKLSLDAM